jgi:beta-phosphoglucomutase family hydrolase
MHSDRASLHPLDRDHFDAILFDLDGVLTETATVHFAAWKAMFDRFLRARAEQSGEPFDEFTEEDYLDFVDGRPRFDGVRTFLASRGIALPDGSPGDPPDAATVGGLGNSKNESFNEVVDKGVEAIHGSVRFVEAARAAGVATAVVSSSANAERVLAAAGIADLFAARIDGVVARDLGLSGKPHPDTFLEGARRLGVAASRAVVVEDALSGVEAGRRGGFGLVVGVGDAEKAPDLLDAGADIVVADLGDLLDD